MEYEAFSDEVEQQVETGLMEPGLSLTWHYDDAGFYGYVMVDGGPSELEAATLALRRQGLVIMMTGRSFRSANNRKRYDWYVRVGQKQGVRLVKPARQAIFLALQPPGVTEPPDDMVLILERRLEAQAAEIQALRAEKAKVEADAQQARGAVARLSNDYALLQRQYFSLNAQRQAEQDELEMRLAEMDGQLAALSARLKNASTHDEAALLVLAEADYQQAKLAYERERQQLESQMVTIDGWGREMEDLRQRLIQAENTGVMANSKTEELQAALDQVRHEAADLRGQLASTGDVVPEEGELARWLGALLPNVRLVRGCESILLHEFADPIHAIKVLGQMQSQPGKLNGERVEGAKPWRELRVSTGQDHTGRIYYAKSNADGYVALISSKHEQDRGDIDYMKRYKF